MARDSLEPGAPGLTALGRDLGSGLADRGEAFANAVHRDALYVVVVGLVRIDGPIDKHVGCGLVGGAGSFDDLGVDALERSVRALPAVDVVAEVVELACRLPLDAVAVGLLGRCLGRWWRYPNGRCRGSSIRAVAQN